MSLPFGTRVALGTILLFVGGCQREVRDYRGSPLPESGPATGRSATLNDVRVPAGSDPRASSYNNNAFQISQGQRLFTWMNCSGCHASGGGGMGPALIDGKWRYGGSIEQIAATILQGRPNGMPSFATRVTEQQAWQLAAFVRSLSAHTPQAARSGRTDEVQTLPPSTLHDPQPIKFTTPKTDSASRP